jgi:PAS domain S-box-containing protein
VDYRFLAVNAAFERLTGLKAGDVVGRTVLEVLPDTERHWIETYGKVVLTGEPAHFESHAAALGKHFEVTAYRSGAGQFTCVFRDITERNRLRRQVEEQRVRAAQIDRLQALGEMATGIAHELNQPLNGIRAFAEGLQIGIDRGWPVVAAELRTTMGEIITQVDRITEIIDHMRTFARPEPEGETRTFALAEPVEGALKLMGAQLRVHGIVVYTEIAADLPPVRGRPNAIEQVLLNLLSNARDALDDRLRRQRAGEAGTDADWRPAVTVRALADASGTDLRLEVADNGAGIPPQIVERLFEPFFTTKEVGKGTGIGLPIIRGIVESHGGRVEVDSRPGDGATFTVVLPRAAP